MDELDKASEQEQAMRDLAIKKASKGIVLKPCGKCLNCGEVLTGDLRWCNADCRDDAQARNEEPAKTDW